MRISRGMVLTVWRTGTRDAPPGIAAPLGKQRDVTPLASSAFSAA